MTVYTIIEIGNMDFTQANKFHEKINGMSYMKFEVIRAIQPGKSYGVSVQSTYDAPRDQILSMLLWCMANSV